MGFCVGCYSVSLTAALRWRICVCSLRLLKVPSRPFVSRVDVSSPLTAHDPHWTPVPVSPVCRLTAGILVCAGSFQHEDSGVILACSLSAEVKQEVNNKSVWTPSLCATTYCCTAGVTAGCRRGNTWTTWPIYQKARESRDESGGGQWRRHRRAGVRIDWMNILMNWSDFEDLQDLKEQFNILLNTFTLFLQETQYILSLLEYFLFILLSNLYMSIYFTASQREILDFNSTTLIWQLQLL